MRISDWSSDVCSSDLTFLAIADDVDAARVDAERCQIIFRGIGTAFAERDVVIAGAAFVGMAFERDANRRVALQPLRLALQRRLILRLDVILVIIEEDAVALQTDVGEDRKSTRLNSSH